MRRIALLLGISLTAACTAILPPWTQNEPHPLLRPTPSPTISPIPAPTPSPVKPPAGQAIYGLTALGGRTTFTPGEANLIGEGEAVPFFFREAFVKASLVEVDAQAKTIRLGHFYRPDAVDATPAATRKLGVNAPVTLDEAGTYRVFGLQSDGRYKEIGTIEVQVYGTPSPVRFEGMRPLTEVKAGEPTTITLWQRTPLPGCGQTYRKQATVDAAARTVDLTMLSYDPPPGMPTCLPSVPPNWEGEYAFTVTLPEPGTYTVRTMTADGLGPVGTVTAR